MSDTSKPNRATHGPHVAGEPAADRLMRSLDYRMHPGTEPVTRDQVAVVLHALADHTAIMAALDHRRDDDSPWPEALSVGRWFHDVADQLDRIAGDTTDGTPDDVAG